MPSLAQRLESKYERITESGCWIWTGSTVWGGYGMVKFNGKNKLAHRVAYEYYTGETIPLGMDLDHKCRVRCCVNPAHLEIVTRKENLRRGLTGKSNNHNARKTHCPRGHEYTLLSTGKRACYTCNNIKRRVKYG